MNFSLLITLVFLVLIFFEITLSKGNFGFKYRNIICAIVISLLITYELYNNYKSIKETFLLPSIKTNNIPLDSDLPLFEFKDKKIISALESDRGLYNLPYLYLPNAFGSVGIHNIHKKVLTFGNKFIENSRISFEKNLSDEKLTKVNFIGDFPPKERTILFKEDNNKFGGAVYYHKQPLNTIQILNKQKGLISGCGDNKEGFKYSNLYNNADEQCRNYLKDVSVKNKYDLSISYDVEEEESYDYYPRHSRIQCNRNINECQDFDEYIFFAGGYNNTEGFELSNKINIYDLTLDKWHEIQFPSREMKYNVEIVGTKDKIYFIGGIFYNIETEKLDYSNKIEIYDLTKGLFTNLDAWSYTEMPHGLTNHKCIVLDIEKKSGSIDNHVLICGGFNDNGYSRYVSIYNPSAIINKFRTYPLPLDTILENISLVSLGNTAIIATGKLTDKMIDYHKNLVYCHKKGIQFGFDNRKVIQLATDDDGNNLIINDMYRIFDFNEYYQNLKNSYEKYTLSITFTLNSSRNSNTLYWVYGKKTNEDTEGLIIVNQKLYPVKYIKRLDSYYVYTNGIEIPINDLVNITIIVDNNDVEIYKNYHINNEYKKFNYDSEEQRMILTGNDDDEKDTYKFTDLIMPSSTPEEMSLNYADLTIEDIKLYDIKLNAANMKNLYIRYYSILNKENTDIDYSSIYIYHKGVIRRNNFRTYRNELPLSNKLAYNIVGSNYKNKYAIFMANIDENNALQRTLLVFNNQNKKWEEESSFTFSKLDNQILLKRNIITFGTTKIGDAVVFTGIGFDDDNNAIGNLDIIDFEETEKDFTPYTNFTDLKIRKTKHIIFGNKDFEYFKGYIGLINVKPLFSEESIEDINEHNIDKIIGYDDYLRDTDNLYVLRDHRNKQYVKGLLRNIDLEKNINMEFLDNELAFYFNGSDSYMFIPNAKANNINLSFWFKPETDLDTVLAYSREGNWSIQVKNKKVFINNISIDNKDIIINKWYYIDVNILSETEKVSAKVVSNLEEAIIMSRRLEKLNFKCKLGQRLDANSNCELCPKETYGIKLDFKDEWESNFEFQNNTINTNRKSDNIEDMDTLFKCNPCPLGTTTFGEKGQTECRKPNFYTKKNIDLSNNGYGKLLNSLNLYDMQKLDIKETNDRIQKTNSGLVDSCNFIPYGDNKEACKKLCKLDNLVTCDTYCNKVCNDDDNIPN